MSTFDNAINTLRKDINVSKGIERIPDNTVILFTWSRYRHYVAAIKQGNKFYTTFSRSGHQTLQPVMDYEELIEALSSPLADNIQVVSGYQEV